MAINLKHLGIDVLLGTAALSLLVGGSYMLQDAFSGASGARVFNIAAVCWDGKPRSRVASRIPDLNTAERQALVKAAELCESQPALDLPPNVAVLLATLVHRADFVAEPTLADRRSEAEDAASQALSN